VNKNLEKQVRTALRERWGKGEALSDWEPRRYCYWSEEGEGEDPDDDEVEHASTNEHEGYDDGESGSDVSGEYAQDESG
jgi:hypothetical protein